MARRLSSLVANYERCRTGSTKFVAERIGLEAQRRFGNRRPPSRTKLSLRSDVCELTSVRAQAALGQLLSSSSAANEAELLKGGTALIFGQPVELEQWTVGQPRADAGLDASEQRAGMELARLGFLVASVGRCALAGTLGASPALKVVEWFAALADSDHRRGQPLDGALRIVHCCQMLDLLAGCQDPELRRLRHALGMEICRSAHWVWLHREVSPVRSNHYLGCLVGLLASSVVLDGNVADKYRRYVDARLPGEIEHQLLADGVFHEGSIFYSKLCLEMLLSVLLIEGGNLSEETRATTTSAVEDAIRSIRLMSWRGGEIPIIGDSDSAQVLRYGGSSPNDLTEVEAVAAALGIVAAPHPHASTSGAFLPVAGILCVNQRETEARVDLGPIGLKGFGGHGHADFGALSIRFGGVDVIVDGGSSVYASDPPRREFERSSEAHNMARVLGREGYDLQRSQPFAIGAKHLEFSRWVAGSDDAVTWFARIVDQRTGVSLERCVEHRDGERIVIFDRASGLGPGDLLATSWTTPIDSLDEGAAPIGRGLSVEFLEVGSANRLDGWWSVRFGEALPCHVFTLAEAADDRGRATVRTEFRFTSGGADA